MSWPPVIAVVFSLAVVVFGAVVDLGLALMVLALMLTASVVAFSRHADSALPDRLFFRSSFAQLSLWTLAAVFIVLVSGVLVAESGSMVRCLGWPMYSGWVIPTDLRGWLQMARRLIAGVASVLIVATVIQAWRTQRRRAAILRTAMAVGVLFLVETLVGALMRVVGFTISLLVIYVATAAALWASVVVLAVLAGLASPTSARGVP